MDIILCSVDQANRYLSHHGIKGQKRGVRRWQNEDGSYTSEGYQHYAEMYGWGKRKTPAHLDKQAKKYGMMAEEGVAKTAVVGGTGAAVAGATYLSSVATKVVSNALANSTPSSIVTEVQYLLRAAHLNSVAKEIEDFAVFTGRIGEVATAACLAGTITIASIAAYFKVRSALQKRKLNKMIANDALKKYASESTVKHSDDGELTGADVLDSLSDEQKLAVLMMIDEILKSNE